LAIVLIATILITCIFQAYQEGKQDDVMQALSQLQANKVTVIRENRL
jgi:magnesium-transporting ATPase (P-type)